MSSRLASRLRCALPRPGKRFAPIAAAFVIALLPGAQGANAGTLAYVTVENGVSVIDTATDTVVDTIEICSPGTPAAASVAVSGSRLYVPCVNERVVKVIDWKTRTLVATLSPPPPDSVHSNTQVAVTPDGAQLYVTTTDGMSIFDTTSNQFVNRRRAGVAGRAVTISPDGSYVYIQTEDGRVSAMTTAIPTRLEDWEPATSFQTEGPVDQPIAFDTILTDTLYVVKSPLFIHSLDLLLYPKAYAHIYSDSNAVATQQAQAGVYVARHGGNVSRFLIIGNDIDDGWFNPGSDVRINSFVFTTDGRYYAVDDRNGTLTVHEANGALLKQIGVTRPRAVTIPVPTVQVTIASSPAGQSFRLNGTGCPSAHQHHYVTPRSLSWRAGLSCTVEFSLPAAAGSREVFNGWTNGSSSPTINTPQVDTTYTATFKTQHQLTASLSPAGSGSISGTGYYDAGSSASISATPAAGYWFANWTGPVASAFSASTTVVMNGPVTVTGNFQLATVTTVASVSSQYSDPVTLSATVGPAGLAFTGSIQFVVNGSNAGAAVPVTGTGTYTTTYKAGLPAGSYTIAVKLTSASPIASASSGTGTLTVNREQAWLGSPLVGPPVSAPGGVANSITITGQLSEAADGSAGNLALANVTITLVPAGLGTNTWTCPGTTNSSGNVTAVCRNVPAGAYTVRWDIAGGYYTGWANTVLAVYDPATRFVTGSGSVIHAGNPVHFAVSMKRNPDGSWTGGSTSVVRSPAGEVLEVASTSVPMMLPTANGMVLSGPARVNGVMSGANFRATVIDNGSPGVNRDLYGFELQSSFFQPYQNVTFSPVPIMQGEIIQVR